MVTYDAPVTIHMNGEDVQLIPVPHAHTDGDTMIYFPKADVLMVGDFYRSIQYPNIDRNNGGSLKGVMDALNERDRAREADDENRPRAWPRRRQDRRRREPRRWSRRSATASRRSSRRARRRKRSIAAKPLADLDAQVQQAGTTGDRFLGQVYAELKAGK